MANVNPQSNSESDSASDAELQAPDAEESREYWTTLPRITDQNEVCRKCKKSCNIVYKRNSGDSYYLFGGRTGSEEEFVYCCNECKELPAGQQVHYYHENGYQRQRPAKFTDDRTILTAYVKVGPKPASSHQQYFILSEVSRSGSTFVNSVKREPNLSFYPTHMLSDPLRVMMTTAPMQVRHFRETAQAPHDAKLAQAKKQVDDTNTLLQELNQALARNMTAFQEAVDGAANNENTELSDIGAMAIERKRIEREIARNNELLPSYTSAYASLKKLQVVLIYELERESVYQPQFYLEEGLNQVDSELYRIERVHVAKPYTVAVKQTQKPKAVAPEITPTSSSATSPTGSKSANLSIRRVRSQIPTD